MEFTKNM